MGIRIMFILCKLLLLGIIYCSLTNNNNNCSHTLEGKKYLNSTFFVNILKSSDNYQVIHGNHG